MSRIDFYILPDRSPNGRSLFACRLAEKAYKSGHRVYIHTNSAEHAQSLDELLWTFRQGSFVPHARYPADARDNSPILIGWGEAAARVVASLEKTFGTTEHLGYSTTGESASPGKLLINLSSELSPCLEQFERVAEVVDQEPEGLVKSREKFRYFRDQGYSPQSHKI